MDKNPDHYDFYLDDLKIESGSLSSDEISIAINGLENGLHNCTIEVFNDYGSAIDTVFVTVVDTITPELNSPADIEYIEGTLGHNIVWQGEDLQPTSFKIFRNGSLIFKAAWDGSNITINIDLLMPGVYNYSVQVFDASGNTASDSVIVTVMENTHTLTTTTTNTTTPEDDNATVLGIGIVIGTVIGAIVVVILLEILKRRSD